MADQILLINKFYGGLSQSSKVGLAGTFRFGNNLDIFSDPDKLQISTKATKDSGGTVTDLILFGVTNTINSNLYFLSEGGKVYKRTSAGVWSTLTTLGGGNGQGLAWFSGTNLIYGVSGDEVFTIDPSGDSISEGVRTLNSATWHPIEPFLDKCFFGNGRTIVSVDASGIEYDEDNVGGGIVLDYNYKARCIKNIGDWLLVGTESDNSSDARYFLWDGTSDFYNYARSMKGENGIKSIEVGDDGSVILLVGQQGHLYQLVGLDSALMKIKTIPRIEKDKTIETYPGSMTSYQGFPVIGLSYGTSVTAERGVYVYGAIDRNYNKALNLSHIISTGTTTGITTQVGCLLSVGTNDLYVCWRDNTTYGVDKIDGSSIQSTALWESLVHDAGQPFRRKYYKNFKVKLTKDLSSGEVITLSYKKDGGSWTSIGTLDYSVDGAIQEKRFKHDVKANNLEIKLAFAQSGSTAPSIDNVAIMFSIEDLI